MSNESNKPEKMDLRSMDISAENRAKMKALFPAVFTETVNDKGELVDSIDFEKLKAELGTFSVEFEKRRERYGMDWPGKKDCMKLIQQPAIGTLKPCREESVDFDQTENLFIEGDNLEVLKLLQKSYYGKIKMIYIDPPYNTGNEFIYPDDYSESLDTYLAYAGLVDDEGKRFSTNTPNEGRFHTKWLNMMYPRLYLARNLLREDGIIFVSIDDNEVRGLRSICDEIYGEENFIGQITWKNVYGGGAKAKHIVNQHEYVLVYAKNKSEIDTIELPPDPSARKRYTEKDNKYPIRGPYYTQPLATTSMDERPNLRFPIIWNGEEIWPEKQWQWSKEKVDQALKEDDLVIKKSETGQWSVRYKQYLRDEDGKERGAKLFSVLTGPWSQAGTAEIAELLGNGKIFPFPKPSELIKHLISACSYNPDAIVLDFFAGSCPTVQSVFNLNKELGSTLKFIMVQLPERCDGESEAFKSGFRTIADIGKERIRRVIKKVNDERTANNDPQMNLPGFKEEPPNLDLGFKVFKLDRSNFKTWDGSNPAASEEEIARQLTIHVDHVLPSATQEDILYELLLKSGFMPTEKVEKLEMGGKVVFSIADGALLICLEDKITRELIDEVAKAEPMQFICLDKGFRGNDQLKANAVQTFAARNQGRDKAEQIVFRTV